MLPKRTSLRLAIFVSFYILYVIIGAAIFSAVEGPVERTISKKMQAMKDKFIHRHGRCLTEEDLDSLLLVVLDANDHGVSALRNVSSESNWSFGQSVFFATSILTTIGYGHVTPLSQGGKFFSVVYAAIGIPLTLILFTALVERLLILTNIMLQALISRLGHLYRTFHIRLIHVSILFSLLLLVVFILPAVVFMSLERNWNYLDAFYYCFISMTTIGLGDYIPGDNFQQPLRPIYKIFTAVYLLVGLVLMMLLLANVYDIPELNLGSHFYMHSDEYPHSGALTDEQKKLREPGENDGYGATEGGASGGGASGGGVKAAGKSPAKRVAEDKEALVDD